MFFISCLLFCIKFFEFIIVLCSLISSVVYPDTATLFLFSESSEIRSSSVGPSGYAVVSALGLEVDLVHEVEGMDWNVMTEGSEDEWEETKHPGSQLDLPVDVADSEQFWNEL